jgi:hypothetical protein
MELSTWVHGLAEKYTLEEYEWRIGIFPGLA